jgi:peptidoglycan-associated lipoprotein
MSRMIWIAGLALVLSACGSSVKLDKTPVEDKSGTVVTQSATGDTASTGVANNAVKPVDLTQSANDNNNAALANTARIVYFDYDSFAIRPEFQSLIEAHAKYIKSSANKKVVIEGHTDERGGREYNLALGQKRAEAVRRALALLGVADSQVEAVSFGKEKPAVLGSSEAAMEKNRRAEISYR